MRPPIPTSNRRTRGSRRVRIAAITPAGRVAFTLIEVLIVVVILGILASVTLQEIRTPVSATRESMFTQQLRTFVVSVQTYQTRRSTFPAEGLPGEIPEDFKPYLAAGAWDRPTPLGGKWQIVNSSIGKRAAIGVNYESATAPRDLMAKVDAIFDDGDLTDGRFREFSPSTYYFVIE